MELLNGEGGFSRDGPILTTVLMIETGRAGALPSRSVDVLEPGREDLHLVLASDESVLMTSRNRAEQQAGRTSVYGA
jgi:hypothetical protein